jgi:TRAP-type C4-dicarboxylate transport system substrate-binding protein
VIRHFIGAALASSLLALPLAAPAQDKMVIKASDVHPPGYPNVVAMENMGKKLE